MFQKNSRYYYIGEQKETTSEGVEITYKKRRFITDAEQIPSLITVVSEGKRIDQVSYATLGNAKLYWKFADANNVFSPNELEQSGKKIRVPSDGSND